LKNQNGKFGDLSLKTSGLIFLKHFIIFNLYFYFLIFTFLSIHGQWQITADIFVLQSNHSHSLAFHLGVSRLFGVEVVFASFSGQNLTIFGDFESLGQ